MAHRSGYQCGACRVRVHQGLTVQALEEHLQAECPQLSLEARLPEPEQPHQPLPKKQTRQQVIKQLLQQQSEQAPPQQQHELEETTGYLRCVRCGANVHKRSNEQLFQAFVQGQCLDQPYEAPHDGHRSHVLWQKGTRVNCTQCGLSLHLDAHQRLILTTAFKKPCKGAGSTGSPLEEFFRRQATHTEPQSPEDSASGSSHQSQHPKAGTATAKRPKTQPQQPAEASESQPKGPGPTPRRLHFPTQLDQHAQGTLATSPAQAMTPSPQVPLSSLTNQHTLGTATAGQAGQADEDASITVDYF